MQPSNLVYKLKNSNVEKYTVVTVLFATVNSWDKPNCDAFCYDANTKEIEK